MPAGRGRRHLRARLGARSRAARGRARRARRSTRRGRSPRRASGGPRAPLGGRRAATGLARTGRSRGRSARHPAGRVARSASGRSSTVPPSTRSRALLRKAAIAGPAAITRSVTSSRAPTSPSTPGRVRPRRNGAVASRGPVASTSRGRNGPLPTPSRIRAKSGWASSSRRCGRGAERRISMTRSVMATTSSTAPSASRVALPRMAPIWRLRMRATSRAMIFRPSGHSPAASRKI